MAELSSGASALQTSAHIPIAQLTPLLAAPASRSIKAVVTLTWPYSSATGSVAFFLSELDFRLRLTRGEVRVQFSGSSAKEIARSGIASGDHVVLSLDGVEYDENTFQPEGSQEVKFIDIDHPAIETETVAPPRIPTPELAISPSAASTVTSSAPTDSAIKAGAEYTSPAFIKRARTSYGSLFESDYDPFLEEDGTVPGKGRKRTRLSSTWRYSSRSPTPEAEESIEESAIVQPEVAAKSPPAMTDEGCQTIGLDDSSAAEALANFARQSMNVGRDFYTSLNGTAVPKDVPRSEAFFENPLTREVPPTFQIQHIDGLEPIDTNQTRPKSPRLQPVSSEFLPQVSPLLSRNALFPANVHSEGGIRHSQNLAAQTPALQNSSQSIGAEPDDIYGASPIRSLGEQVEAEVSSFQDPNANMDGIEQPILEHHFNAEDQYGRWQNSTHLSHHASPYHAANDVVEEAQADDRFYVEEGGEEVEQFSHDGFPASHADMLHSHQYPEIDDGLSNQQLPGWGASDIQYPELQNYGAETPTIMQPPQPHSAAMSRSHSGQSQVVDLTESSDEEGPPEVALEHDEEDMEDEEEEEVLEDEGSSDEEEQPRADVMRSPYFSQREIIKDEEGIEEEDEGSEGEEQYYDDEEEDDGADTIDERFNVPPGQEFYDEEEEEEYESEEEDMEDAAPHSPHVQQAPVFIDLLSSDDEDDPQPPQPKPVASALARYSRSHDSEESAVEEEQDEEEEEEEEGSNDEDEVPYAEREELEIRHVNQERSRGDSSEEDEENDEIMEIEREQDDLDGSYEHIEEESGIAARSERQLPHESIVESGDDQPVTDGHGVGNDLVNASTYDQDQPVEAKIVEATTPVEAESSVKVAIPGRFGRSSPTKSLFQRVFNFDGANDELGDEVSYPELPKDEHSLSAVEQQTTSLVSDILPQKTANTQLPTPDATQSFGKTVSTETSFTSSTDIPPARIEQLQGAGSTTIKMETEESEFILNTSGPVDVEVEMEQIETAIVTNETAKIKLSDDDIEMNQDGQEWIVEQLRSTTDAASEDQIVEEPMVEEEHPNDAAVEYNPAQEKAAGNEKSLQLVDPELSEPEAIQDEIDEQIMEEKLAVHTEEPDSITADDVQEQIAEQFAEEQLLADVTKSESTNPDSSQEQVDEQFMEDEAEAKPDELRSTENELSGEVVAGQEPVHDIAENLITVDSSPPKQIESSEIAFKEPEFTIDSPRRSNRRAKPSVIVASAKESVRPTTPTKLDRSSARARREPTSPEVVLDARAPPKGHDASIELALASLESPSKPQHDLRKPPVADLKLRLSRALRTELSEFTALKVLRYHLNQKLDVLAVATTTPEEPQRAKNGPRHYQITLNVTDPSIAPSGVTEIQIFRPYKDALPTIQAGDGLLLRNFQVISVKNRGFGMRSVTDEGSSWVVFKESGEPEVRGPPVEFGVGEKNHVIELRAWYKTLDAAAIAKISRANGDKAGVGVGKSIAKAS